MSGKVRPFEFGVWGIWSDESIGPRHWVLNSFKRVLFQVFSYVSHIEVNYARIPFCEQGLGTGASVSLILFVAGFAGFQQILQKAGCEGASQVYGSGTWA